MAQNSGMSISDLINSSAQVKGYGAQKDKKGGKTLSDKKFGSIYAFNKRVKVKPESSVIEISMLIEACTEKNKNEKGYHKVMVAIAGVEQEEVTADRLVSLLRANAEYADEEKYDNETLIKMALTQTSHKYGEEKQESMLPGRTVFESDNSGKYVIVNNEIKDSSRIQVWCSCSSYYWVFQYYNMKAGANIKTPSTTKSVGAYQYKTQKGFEAFKNGRPIRNPNQKPGLCKHLMLLLAMLIETETIQERSKAAKDVVGAINFNNLKYNERISAFQYDRKIEDFEKSMRVINNERKLNAFSGEVARSQRETSIYQPKGIRI